MDIPQQFMSPAKAIAVGTLVVNAPVVAILLGVSLLAVRSGLSVPLSCFLAFVIAWIWWSVSVPRWRLWAYQRVASTGTLQKWAVRSGLVYPKGSLPERTEIKSSAHRQLEVDFERQRP